MCFRCGHTERNRLQCIILKMGTQTNTGRSKAFFCLPLIFAVLGVIGFGTTLFAENENNLEDHLTLGIGVEQLEYEEHEPETGMNSSATLQNFVFFIEAQKTFSSLFVQINSTFPVFLGEDKEHWYESGRLYQTNELEYQWIRADASIGYSLISYFNPFVGLRWSHVTQDRDNFVVQGNSKNFSATETVKAWYLTMGAAGYIRFQPKWTFAYELAYCSPIHNTVTNDALAGWKASDANGYTVEIEGRLGYQLKQSLAIELTGYGGRTHWNGSDWQPYMGGIAKWPENDTNYLGLRLQIVFFI